MAKDLPLRNLWVSLALILALSASLAACSSPEQRAQAHYESGKQLLQAGEFAKAGLEFRNALKYNEKLSDAWLQLAAVEERAQNWPAVQGSLERVVELDPNNREARVKLAKLQLATNTLDKALVNTNVASELKKDDTEVLALRAAILFRLNDREGARDAAERALSLNPDNPEALAVLAADQITDQNWTAALRLIDRGLIKDKDNVGLLLFKLKVFTETKDDPKLEVVLRQLIALLPDNKQLHQALLSLLAGQNRTADLETELRTMVAADPKDTGTAFQLVRFVGSIKGTAEARKELLKLVAARPDLVSFKLALAQLDFSDRQTDAAMAAVADVIAKGEPKADVQLARLLLANMKTQLGRDKEAKAIIDEILADDAKNADALGLRANYSLTAGDAESAVIDLREALNQQPKSVPLMVLLGRALERLGTIDLARDRLTEALKLSNYNPQITLDFIAFLQRRGEPEQVEAVLVEAVGRNPGNRQLLAALAQSKLNRKDWVGAQAVAQTLNKIGDRSPLSSQIEGALLLGQQKYTESVDVLKEAYASAPQTVQLMDSLIAAYISAGKTSEAEAFIQSILVANPNNAQALAHLASIRVLQKRPQEAEATFKLAIDRQPNNPIGYVALARYYTSQNKAADAEDVLRRGRAKIPRDLAINLGLAGLLELRNDPEGAIAIYEEQIKATPDAHIIVNNLASLLADFRSDAADLQRATQLSRRLTSLDVPQFKDTVGWVAYRSGDYRTALLNLEAAAKELPDLALVKFHLAMTYLALKRTTDAKEQLAKAEALLKDGDALKEKINAAVATLPASN